MLKRRDTFPWEAETKPLNAPIQYIFLSVYHKFNSFIDKLKIAIRDENLRM